MLIQNNSKVLSLKKKKFTYYTTPTALLFPNDSLPKKILVYNICLISISDTVFDGVAKTLVLNMERPSKKFEPDVFE